MGTVPLLIGARMEGGAHGENGRWGRTSATETETEQNSWSSQLKSTFPVRRYGDSRPSGLLAMMTWIEKVAGRR